ncbi:hypothetical protein ZEAMMB73_Zm00001d005325 [Zea mays]|uniref:Uncharacterized protein n=1 Tax=Zea mays TaxID=4577 RepID=B6SK37_MAIZE|nr:hypothetical protein [Zea mays]ONM20848.1 hypothetical protein ZEAMMB73_Zm00001d005325 [Zea mays]
MSSDLHSASDVIAGRRLLSRLQHLSASFMSFSACTSGQGPADASSTLCTASIFTASRACSATLRSSSPVSICRITMPNAYTSDSVVSSPVMKNTGSMYPAVPIGFVRRPMVSSSSGFTCTARAVPKSPSRLALPASRRMLVSFTSAWMMAWGRLEWRYASAERSSPRILTRSFHRRPLESLSLSVPLGRCSYTRPHDSGHTPISLTMCGCSNLLSTTT